MCSLAKQKLLDTIQECQQALKYLEEGDKRKAIGRIDEAEFQLEGAKWVLINEVIEEEGDL